MPLWFAQERQSQTANEEQPRPRSASISSAPGRIWSVRCSIESVLGRLSFYEDSIERAPPTRCSAELKVGGDRPAGKKEVSSSLPRLPTRPAALLRLRHSDMSPMVTRGLSLPHNSTLTIPAISCSSTRGGLHETTFIDCFG